ncbi:MAG: UDP-2,3-diacylglucosamine diphosphatase [Dysgonamonadaceae bacterium]|jgi:UDP-2,3-diacylglucosamine hydrolase|nr:UDP-2,3-diacylglucosamine diphosphatase [Dysgonamonadaceae bacterium]
MAKDKIYFASDLHLGSDTYEEPLISEKRFVRWLDSIKDETKALYLLGDVFDFWFEYKRVVPKGFTRFLGKLAEMNDNGTEIHFFIGNHDIWFFDYLPKEIGAIVHKEPLVTELYGKKFFLSHGDGLGDDSQSFKLLRSIFHNPFCQFLFARFIPSAWGLQFGSWWAKHNRKQKIKNPISYLGEDKEHLVLFSKQIIKEHPDIDYLIFGHRHILLDLMLSKKNRMMIIGDWMTYFSYAVFDGKNLLLEQY